MWDGWDRVGRPAARWTAPAVHGAALVPGPRGSFGAHRQGLERAHHRAAPRAPGDIAASFAAFAGTRPAPHTGEFTAYAPTARDCRTRRRGTRRRTSSSTPAPGPSPPRRPSSRGSPTPPSGSTPPRRPPGRAPRAPPVPPAPAAASTATPDAPGDPVAGGERAGARFERARTLVPLPVRAAEGTAEPAALGCPPAG
jgi:hypothetical protein